MLHVAKTTCLTVGMISLLTIGRTCALNAQTYSGPIVITHGGTYIGNWQSNDPAVPAVTIKTNEYVEIQNSNIKSQGDLIKVVNDYSGNFSANLGVFYTSGYGLGSLSKGYHKGRFVNAPKVLNLVVEHCYMESVYFGIDVGGYTGNGQPDNTLRIRYNYAKNIDGRVADGKGGYVASSGQDGNGYAHFIGIANSGTIQGVDISWNQVINEPYNSAVEDIVNVYRTSGTGAYPLRIRNNYFQGAFPVDPLSSTFSGGGIIVDGEYTTFAQAPSNIVIDYNQVVATTNAGIGIAAGHDNVIAYNRTVASGLLSNGSYLSAQNVGIYVLDIYNNGSATFFNNGAYSNDSGWVNRKTSSGRYDYDLDDANPGTYNGSLPNPITRSTEIAECNSWKSKLSQNHITIGPTTVAPYSCPTS